MYTLWGGGLVHGSSGEDIFLLLDSILPMGSLSLSTPSGPLTGLFFYLKINGFIKIFLKIQVI